VHGILDYGVAGLCLALPRLLGVEDSSASKAFRGQGIGESGIAGVTDYSDTRGQRRQFERGVAWAERRTA